VKSAVIAHAKETGAYSQVSPLSYQSVVEHNPNLILSALSESSSSCLPLSSPPPYSLSLSYKSVQTSTQTNVLRRCTRTTDFLREQPVDDGRRPCSLLRRCNRSDFTPLSYFPRCLLISLAPSGVPFWSRFDFPPSFVHLSFLTGLKKNRFDPFHMRERGPAQTEATPKREVTSFRTASSESPLGGHGNTAPRVQRRTTRCSFKLNERGNWRDYWLVAGRN